MNHRLFEYSDIFDSSFEDEECDAASLASLQDELDDSFPEKILAEHTFSGTVRYLIKWHNCQVIRSSWENVVWVVDVCKHLLEAWEQEKLLIKQGKKPSFDFHAFTKAVDETEKLERGRRDLRRWKRHLRGILAAISTSSKLD